MRARAMDHVNLQIPEDRVEEALGFYRDALGFGTERLEQYRAGDTSIFTFRLGESAVVHVRPVDPGAFESPADTNFDHFCIVLEASVERIRDRLEEHGVEIEREGTPRGATGSNPAVYVRDPFGYLVELKQARSE